MCSDFFLYILFQYSFVYFQKVCLIYVITIYNIFHGVRFIVIQNDCICFVLQYIITVVLLST